MTVSKKKYNKYDTYIFLLIASLVAGNMFGAFQVPRILAILFFIPCLQSYSKISYLIREMKNWLLVFLLYSVASCLWTPVGATEGIIEATYNIVHAMLFIEIIVFSRVAKNPINAILWGFLVAFVVSAIIAIWELTTDQHLYTSKTKEAKASNTGYEIYLRYFAAVTFYNFNMYVTFLCFLFPFLFYGINSKKNNRKLRILFVAATVTAVILVLYNGSRGGLLAILIMAIVYFSYSLFRVSGISIYTLLFVGLLAFVLFSYGSTILNTLIMRSSVQDDLGDESRLMIWSHVYEVVKDYLGLGCGAGGLSVAMIQYARGGVLVAHNLFLEILSQYGILFLCVFVLFLYKLFRRTGKVNDKNRRICLYQALFALPVVSIINSGYLTQPVLWAVMAALYVFANYEHIRFFYKDIRQAT